MDNAGINLFKSDANEIAMPQQNMEYDEKLTEDPMGEAISGEQVNLVLLPIKDNLDPDNYVLDFTKTPIITIFQKEAIKSLIYRPKKKLMKDRREQSKEKQELKLITIYMYREGKEATALGKGEQRHLEIVLPILKKHVFGDNIRIFKDYVKGMPATEIASDGEMSWRLNL